MLRQPVPDASLRAAARKRVFVRTATVDDRDRNIKQAEINRELSAMVVPVIQHDRPHDTDSGLVKISLSPALRHQAPRALSLVIP